MLEVILLLAALQTDGVGPIVLNLSCAGGGIAEISNGTYANAYDNYGNSVTITGRSSNAVNYRSITEFRMIDDEGQIRLPKAILPPIRGGTNGWFEVKKLEISETRITGKAAVNFLNNPEFTINRLTGILSINSKKGSFTGECKAYDEAKQKPKF